MWRPEGLHHALQRVAQKVKLRGFGIELGVLQHSLDLRHQIHQFGSTPRAGLHKGPWVVGILTAFTFLFGRRQRCGWRLRLSRNGAGS
eukprot:Skav203187  [mRNA]  locus=scaffold39:340815:344697:- [translate_table: standard]